MKKAFDKNSRTKYFWFGDLVLRCNARNEDKGKHEKFNNLWTGSFKIDAHHRNNAYFLEELNGECIG
jgi:hypothetical protein